MTRGPIRGRRRSARCLQPSYRSEGRIAWQAQDVARKFEPSGCDRPNDDFLKSGAHSRSEPFRTEDVDAETHELVRWDLDPLADEVDHLIGQLLGSNLVHWACPSWLLGGDVAAPRGGIEALRPDELAERVFLSQFARYQGQECLRPCLREP